MKWKEKKTKTKHSIMPSGTGGINANFQTEWDKAWTMQIQPHSLELSPSPQMQPCDWEEMAKTVKWRRRECITRGRRRLWRRMSFSEGPSLGLIWNAADSKNCFINHSIPAGWREKKTFPRSTDNTPHTYKVFTVSDSACACEQHWFDTDKTHLVPLSLKCCLFLLTEEINYDHFNTQKLFFGTKTLIWLWYFHLAKKLKLNFFFG